MKKIVITVLISLFSFILYGCDDLWVSSSSRSEIPPPQEIKTEKLNLLDTFAQCISDKGAIIYGTEWCGYCNKQKDLFAESFDYINFVDCDKQSDLCDKAGINGYPTWIFADGSPGVGVQSFETLEKKTGCKYE